MSAEQNRINELQAAIGKNDPNDYVISPLAHAEQLREKAPSLVSLLEEARIRTVAESYQVADREAGEAQKRFQSLSFACAVVRLRSSLLHGVSSGGWELGGLAGSVANSARGSPVGRRHG